MSDSMGHYAAAARQDGIDILRMVDEDVGLPRARKSWQSYSVDLILELETVWCGPIAAFLKLTPSRRPGYLRKQPVFVDDDQRTAFLVLCALTALRVAAFLDLRDRYSHALHPGGAYRKVTADVAEMLTKVDDLFDTSWPTERLWGTGLEDGSDDESE